MVVFWFVAVLVLGGYAEPCSWALLKEGCLGRVNWIAVGIARWYDCKLGRMNDRALANLVGTTEESIRRRRVLFKIEAYSVDLAIEPFAHLFGIKSKPTAAELAELRPIAPPARPYQAALSNTPGFPIRQDTPYRHATLVSDELSREKMMSSSGSTVKALRSQIPIIRPKPRTPG